MKITNTQKGPRGVNTVGGPVLVDPGKTIEVDVYKREKEHIEATGWFKVEGSYKSDPPTSDADGKADASGDGASSALAAKDAEIAELRKQLEAAKSGGAPEPFKAEHHGGGKFNVTQGEAVILSGLSKTDADAFNAMSDEDKAKFVEQKKAA